MLKYLSSDIVCSSKLTVFPRDGPLETLIFGANNVRGQQTFSRQMEVIIVCFSLFQLLSGRMKFTKFCNLIVSCNGWNFLIRTLTAGSRLFDLFALPITGYR